MVTEFNVLSKAPLAALLNNTRSHKFATDNSPVVLPRTNLIPKPFERRRIILHVRLVGEGGAKEA